MMTHTERSIVMTPGENGNLEDRSRLLRAAFENLAWAAAGFRGKERAQAIQAMKVVSDLMGDADTIEDINHMVEHILDTMVEHNGPSAITESDAELEHASV